MQYALLGTSELKVSRIGPGTGGNLFRRIFLKLSVTAAGMTSERSPGEPWPAGCSPENFPPTPPFPKTMPAATTRCFKGSGSANTSPQRRN